MMINNQPASVRLHSWISRWGLRLRLAESLVWGPWGAAAGLGIGLLPALAARLWPLTTAPRLAAIALLSTCIGGAVGLGIVWLRPRPPVRLARLFDRRFVLAERLTTALEIASGHLQVAPAMAAAQLADTFQAAGQVAPKTALPLRPSRWALVTLGILAGVLALSLWFPNPQEAVLAQRAAVRAAVEEQVAELEATREQVAEVEGLTEAERQTLLRVLDEAIAALEEGRASPEEALAALAQAEQALAPLQDPGAGGVRAGLERAARRMSDSKLTRDIAEALAQGDYQTAAQALAAYSDTKGEMLTREEELELARELAQAAEALAASEPALAEQLAQAAEAIERGEIAQARAAIREAAQQMGAAGERVERQEAVEGALAQLQEGRAQIAQASGRQSGTGQMAQQGARGQGSGGAGEQEGGGAGEQEGGGAGEQEGGGAGEQGGEGAGGQADGGQQTRPGHHEDSGTGAPYDKVYVPYRLDEQGMPIEIGREGDEGFSLGDTPLPASESGRATVPYREVYAGYAAKAGAALEGSYIPLGMKQYVRDYFSSLEP